ncbi:Uu.00g107720.m01.CDS01 [Anthostomella pinea]|uniref:Uu.00g107720.m01.CDS01 n=1 Tax=Anthostomella pinea TaxID=933095 RepID=A0AAI8VEE9_9PEZI|nr:Uu.00g107720.m01.CDS01 [Anthostomella pinea]
MAPQPLPPGLQQEYDSFWQEILMKLLQEIRTLGTTIFRTVNSQASGQPSETRSGKFPGTNELSNDISVHLEEVAEQFVRSIDAEFNRRFSSLSVSTEPGPIQGDATAGGSARARIDTRPRETSIRLTKDVHWADLQKAIKSPEDHDLLGVKYTSGQAGKGFSRLTTSMRTEFEFPNFEAINGPLKSDIDMYLQQLTNNPPKRPIPYYVGPVAE